MLEKGVATLLVLEKGVATMLEKGEATLLVLEKGVALSQITD